MPACCPACGASNPPDTAYCGACGAELATAAPTAAVEDKVDRALASRELGRAMRVLRRVKTLYGVLALVNLTVAVILSLQAVQFEDTEATGSLWLLAGFSGALAVLLAVGSLQLHHNPFAWSIVLACLQTLDVASSIALTDGVPFLGILIAVGCWCAVSLLTSVTTLMAKYPDLRAAKRIRGKGYHREGARGRIGQQVAETRAAERRGRLRVAGAIGALIVALIVYVFWPPSPSRVVAAPKPHEYSQPEASLEPQLETFRAGWTAKNVDAIGTLYPERLARRRARLRKRFAKHDMTDFPELGPVRVRVTGDNKQEAEFESMGGSITTVFQYEGDQWVMVALRF